MQYSLKQIIKEVEALALAHGQVKSFHYGDTLSLLESSAIEYSTVLMNVSRVPMDRGNTNFNIELLVLDQSIRGDEQGRLNSENTTLRIARDLINTISYSTRWRLFSELNTSSPIQKMYDEFEDVTTGWSVSISLEVFNNNGICDLPIFDYDFEQTIPLDDCDILAIVTNTDNTQLATKIVSDTDNIILIPNINFTDSNGNTSSVASGVDITATQCTPFEDATVHNSNDSYSTTVGSGEDLELPNSEISINGSLFESLPATNDLDIDVIQSTGNTTVGNKQGQFYRIGDSNVTNSDGSFNTNIQSEDNLVLNDNTITDSDGLPTSVPAQNDFTCKPLKGVDVNKTGRTVSAVAGDDGDEQQGRGVDFFTLSYLNGFNNTNRFTDTLGGQTYSNNIILDWSTLNGDNVRAYSLSEKNGFSRNTKYVWIFTQGTITIDGFSNWFVTNLNQSNSLVNLDYSAGLNYPPFNASTVSGQALITSSTSVNNSSFSKATSQITFSENNSNYTGSCILTRMFTLTELGL